MEALIAAVPNPVGAWDFNDPQNLLRATSGRNLRLQGQHAATVGAGAGDGAVRIGVGSHYVCDHAIGPQSPASFVNRFSLLYDLRVPALGPWYCLFQTDPLNENDGDCFIRAGSGTVGVGATGYSTAAVTAGQWQRMIVAVDHFEATSRIYLDGQLILEGHGQPVDGRFSLASTLLLFADEDGEDGALDVSRVAIYDVCLSESEAAELGRVPTADPGNQAPVMVATPAGPPTVATGQSVTYAFAATDPEASAVQVQVDWGDGSTFSPWSNLTPSGTPISMSHAYRTPGTWTIRALPQDAGGAVGAWTAIQTVGVTGQAWVEFLALPYLQNVKTDGITVMWEMDGAADAVLDYGPDTSYGATATATRAPSGANTVIYKCVLTGLAPGTRYVFRCRAGNQEETGMFTTAPAGSEAFTFSVWSDSQGSNHGAYAADPLEPTKSMMRHMAANGIDLGVTSGDLAESGDSYADTHQFYVDRVAGLLGRTVPWFVAWGNHDSGPTSVIRRFADLPSQDRPGYGPGHGSYAFNYAGCHFICLDYASAYQDVSNWLETDLQSDANQSARFTFLFVHVPPFCELWIDGDDFFRGTLVPLMEAYGVDACFSGHTHEYSRGFLNGVYYCITGGGSWLDLPEVLVYDWPHMTVGGQHAIDGITKPGPERGGGLINEYVRVEVRGDTFTASMIGFNPDGTVVGVLDQFSKTQAASSHPPDAPRITGPAEVNVFEDTALVLQSSAFADSDPQDTHLQSVWRLARTTNLLDAAGLVLERTTGPQVLAWTAPLTNLWPGQTVYASVKHVASDGRSSPFAPPVAIRLAPEPVYHEDFESTPELSLPAGWVATHRTTINNNTADPDDPLSNAYLTWTVVSRDRLARVFGANRVNVAEALRGQTVYAESDQRSGAQLQYLTTPDVDLSGVTKVVLMFRSNYMQNQDSLGALECSTNGGSSWKPVLYLLDQADVVARSTGSGWDGLQTFSRVDPDAVPTADGRSTSGGTYGEHVLSRPFEDLGAFISPRVNDDATESKRVERCRVTAADGQPRVRFRFTLVGTASWFWGVDDFSLFGERLAEEPIRIVRATRSADGLDLEWTGPAGPYQLQDRANLESGAWVDSGNPIPATQRTLHLFTPGLAGFYRLRLAR